MKMKITVEMMIELPDETEDPIHESWEWMHQNMPQGMHDWQIVDYDEDGELV